MTIDPKQLSLDYIATPTVLSLKLEKLQNNDFYKVCEELKPDYSLESFDKITLFSFLKKHFASHRPKAVRQRAPSKLDRIININIQRRKNGYL